jgi:hypothetical protein
MKAAKQFFKFVKDGYSSIEESYNNLVVQGNSEFDKLYMPNDTNSQGLLTPTGHINDGIITKDGQVISTSPEDNIIASKATPKVVNSKTTYSNNAKKEYDNSLILSILEKISDGVEGMVINEKKSVENLEVIKNSSQKTAKQTRMSTKLAVNI